MLPDRAVLTRLIRANTSFLIYGQKASGKTTMMYSLFEASETKYIEINCTLANKRSNFLKLFSVQLRKYLKQHGFVHENKQNKDKADILSTTPVNLDSWINQIKKIIHEREQIIDILDGLYIFMDNIEEMVMSESFLPSFYAACQKEFLFKFSFVFCGINFLKKQYSLELPFRTMIAFCMPKPIQEYEQTISKTVQAAFKEHYKDQRNNVDQLQKMTKTMTVQIKAAFQNIELNLQKMKSIAKSIVDSTVNQLDQKLSPSQALSRLINIGSLNDIIKKVKQHGPQEENMMRRQLSAIDTNQETLDVNPNLQYYPNLILTSIHLADYYGQKEDKRRFQDYKNRTNNRNKDLKRSDFKIGRHNINRIIAIADVLQSQAKANEKERILDHHSLDFYAQFEHLRKINRIKYNGNKLTGVVKEEEAKAFMAKNDLRYEQFMSNN